MVFSNEVTVAIASSGPANITLSTSATSVTLASSTDLFTLTGTVTDDVGNLLSGVNVYIWFEMASRYYVEGPVTTDSSGNFTFDVPYTDVAVGTANIWASDQSSTAP